jgi:Phage integrase, N-terminal SAM-like domain
MSAIPDLVDHAANRTEVRLVTLVSTVLQRQLQADVERYARTLVEQLVHHRHLMPPTGRPRASLRSAAVTGFPRSTIRSIHEEWIDRRRRLGLRNTRNERAQLVNHVLPVLGDLPLTEIRVRHIRELVDGMRSSALAPRTVRSIYGTLHKLFADLVVDEVLATNPCMLTKDQLPMARDKDPEWRAGALFTRDELELLISARAIPDDRRVINSVTLLTGTRFGEFAGLHWRSLDEHTRPLMQLAISHSYDRETKTATPRLVPVHPVLAEILMEWKAEGFARLMGRPPRPDDLLVPSRTGRMRSRHQHRNKFIADLERLGLRHRRVHDTRRTLVTLARVDGARRDVLEQITHAPRGNILDLYTSLPWPTLCEAIQCLNVRRLDEGEVSRRLSALGEVRRES